jgi:sialate O-acetylesterase
MKRIITLLLMVLAVARADVRLPAIFSDHAVLRKSTSVPVWGWAEPGEKVEAKLGDASVTAVAGQDGKWRLQLDLSKEGAGPFDLIVRGKNELKVSDVLVGEVWVCAGQSNMEMKLSQTGAKVVVANAQNPLLRHFKVAKTSAATPAEDVTGKWLLAVAAGAGDFTAVGYYFGQAVQEAIGGPVGLINLSWGGSVTEAWMSPETLARDEELAARVETLRMESHPAGKPPVLSKTPSGLFHGMLSPVLPYAITGAIWYQGESNARPGLSPLYRKSLRAMVEDWRQRWGCGDFPFYICQLPNFQAKSKDPAKTGTWTELREAQTKFLETPNTGMAVLIDVGEEKGLHPINKKDPGERLARIALAKTYGRDLVFSGPVFEAAKAEDGKLRVRFSHAEGGLKATPLPASYAPRAVEPDKTVPLARNTPESEIEGFAICGADGKWAWAFAKIDGPADVLVWSPQVPRPVSVRYAWSENPTCNLANGAGLPAAPFRTDNFPGIPKPKQAAPRTEP